MGTIIFLGTCSGTEPMPGRHHSSVVFEINGTYYWFDAGESCSHTAYTSGIDVTRIRAIFISHMHIDHVGGLANLIFTDHAVADVCKYAGSRKIKKLLFTHHGREILYGPDAAEEKISALGIDARICNDGDVLSI